jgi:hypothetical protein
VCVRVCVCGCKSLYDSSSINTMISNSNACSRKKLINSVDRIYRTETIGLFGFGSYYAF